MHTTRSQRWLTLYVSSVTLAGLALLAWALPSVRDNPFVVAGLLVYWMARTLVRRRRTAAAATPALGVR